jgi:hypothetical protein
MYVVSMTVQATHKSVYVTTKQTANCDAQVQDNDRHDVKYNANSTKGPKEV